MSPLDATVAMCELVITAWKAFLAGAVVWYGTRFVVELLRATWRMR